MLGDVLNGRAFLAFSWKRGTPSLTVSQFTGQPHSTDMHPAVIQRPSWNQWGGGTQVIHPTKEGSKNQMDERFSP